MSDGDLNASHTFLWQQRQRQQGEVARGSSRETKLEAQTEPVAAAEATRSGGCCFFRLLGLGQSWLLGKPLGSLAELLLLLLLWMLLLMYVRFFQVEIVAVVNFAIK